MKKILYFSIILMAFFLTITYREEILIFCNDYFSSKEKVATKLQKNDYYRNYDFKYVANTTNFKPQNKQDLLNIYYTVINSGMDTFTFYCEEEYQNCLNDVKDIANNQVTISNINNFVHPYNGFKDLETEIDTLGKVTLNINRNYTEQMQIILNYKVDEIIKNTITPDMSIKEKIKTIHDYIINNTKYDQARSDSNIISYQSDTAYGALVEGYALCGGYTDSMMLFLEKFGVKSYKISSDNHVWNYVYVDNNWYNLDLTWDDPINSDGSDSLEDTFFLITSAEMAEIDTTEHNYDKNVYME